MHKKRASSNPAYVPFAWEESPGVPKRGVSQEIPSRLLQAHPAIISFPLCKPPCLQVYHIQGPLAKTPSFNSIYSAPRHGSKLLVRRSSFDNIIFSRSKSGHVESFLSPMKHNADGSGRMEDDPFLMAFQACRKESVRVLHHLDTGRTKVREEDKAYQRGASTRRNRVSHNGDPRRIRACEEEKATQRNGSVGRNQVSHHCNSGRNRACEEEKANQRSGSVGRNQVSHHRNSGRNMVCEEEKANGGARNRQDVDEGFIKHTTGQLLFAQHLQQDGHMQTRIVQKKRANGLMTFFASCFGCHYLTSH